MSRPLVLLVALAAALPAGCSGDGKPAVVPVTGRVTFKGPKGPEPAAGALVVFHPAGADKVGVTRPNGTVKDDGTFLLTTAAPDDGAPPGEYGVTVVWHRAKGGAGPLDRERTGALPDVLGGRYGEPKSPRIKHTVTAAGPNQFDIVVE